MAVTEVAVVETEDGAETVVEAATLVAVEETVEEAETMEEAATEAVVDSDNVAKVAVAVLADIEDFTN